MAAPTRIIIDGLEYFGSYYIDEFGAVRFLGFPVEMENSNE